jgi:multiple sugar transport system substrate-binding protein
VAAAAQGGLTGEIVVSFADSSGLRQPYATAAAAAVQEANPGTTITIDGQTISGSEYQARFFLSMRSGQLPDVFMLNGAAIGLLAQSNAVLALDDYLAAWPDWSFYPQPVKDAATYEGKVWALPYSLDTHFLYFNRSIFEQAGLPRDWQPANVGAILDAAVTVKQLGSEVIPYAIYAGEVGGNATAVRGFLPLLYAYGGTLQDEQGKWIIDSPAIRQTFAYYARAFREEELVPQALLATPDLSAALAGLFGSGKLAMVFDGAWVYGPWSAADPAATSENVGYLLHPTTDAGPSFTVGGTGNVWFVSATCQYPDLAFEFLKVLSAKETVAAINIADPHPPARSDAAELSEYQSNPFLVDATASLEVARFAPPSPAYIDVIPVIQRATGLVATGAAAPDEAAARYSEDLEEAFGADNVVTQA